MKILLIGEFSGFFKNLKVGFQSLGHEVTLMASGDGWKKIDGADIKIDSKKLSIFGKIERRLKLLYYLVQSPQFDVILIINPNIGLDFIITLFSFIIKKKSKKVFLSACGDDIEYLNYGKNKKFDYWPYNDHVSLPLMSKNKKNIHRILLRKIDYVIPVSYDYAVAWRNSIYKKIVLPTIPLPIDTTSVSTEYSKKREKIIFFHGLNREEFKGTNYIKEALLYMQDKFPNDIEVVIEGKIPLKEYLELLKKSDVIVDQCKVYSYASMNTLYSLAMGKIVMGGFRGECKEEFGFSEEPLGIIHIEPNVQQIKQQIEYIIKNKHNLIHWGENNRSFVEKNHDSKVISKKYINVFNSKII